MPTVRYDTAGNIVNDAAVEVGLSRQTDPFSTQDPAFASLVGLLTGCGRELMISRKFPRIVRVHSITVQSGDSGEYTLPDDFAGIVGGTVWETTGNEPVPAVGPEQWASYVAGGASSGTFYTEHRLNEGEFWVWPQPPTVGKVFRFEYYSRGWVVPASDPTMLSDRVAQTGDTVLFEPVLMVKMLKLRWRAARGFDTKEARDEYNVALAGAQERGLDAPVLSLISSSRVLRLLGVTNIPERGYG